MTLQTKGAGFAAMVRGAGLRATSPRTRILEALSKEKAPLSAADIARKFRGRVDGVTVYRTLESLSEAGVVRRTDFRHGHAEYELVSGKPHHHHLVCETCGRVEDFTNCNYGTVEKRALREVRGFATIQSHAMELFGLCIRCFKNS